MKQSGLIQVIILILFFLSGACGLIYEVVWQRMLSLVFGNATFATATILACFMSGLALGSFYFGRLVDKYKEPLKLYAYLEAGIGVFAILVPFMISGITAIYISIYQHFHTTFYFFSLLKFALCFVVLLIPTFLMGGTLPVISKLFVREFEKLGRGVGSLYGTNTFGAVVGTFCAGFFFIILFGAKETTYIAAATNILIAGVALGLNKFSFPDDSKNAINLQHKGRKYKGKNIGEIDHQAYPKHVFHVVLFVYALSGFCALAYEVLWTRVLVFFFSSTTYAFTIMLTTFLFGLALGSLIFGKFIDKMKNLLNLLNLLALIEVLIGLFAIASIWELSKLDGLIGNFYKGESWYTFVVARYVGAFLIMFIPCLLMGISFPLVCKIYTQNRERLGTYVGNIYSANTIGCVLGAFAAGFIMIPLIGITNSIILIASLNLILGVIILFSNPFMRRRLKQAALAGMAVIIVVSILVIPSEKPLPLYNRVSADIKWGGEIIFYKEGVGATVTVHQFIDPSDNKVYKMLEVDGVSVAGTTPALRTTQKLQGHLPLLLYESSTGKDPKNVFILGLGTGESSYAITCHNIEKVDCLEIVPAEVDAIPYFKEVNKDILNNPKFCLEIQDARNYLLAAQENYDIIESDAVHPGLNINIFTREYFQLCKERLSENGIFSTWLPLFYLSEPNLKILLKTFQSVFPYVTVWYSPNYHNRHALLIGTETKLKIDFKLLQQKLQNYEIKKSLEEVGLDDIFTLLSCFITDESKISKCVENSLINTDNRPYLPYYIPKQQLFGRETIPKNLELLNELSMPVFPYLVNMGEAEIEIKTALRNHFEARRYVFQGIAYDFKGDFENEIYEFKKALAINPKDKNTEYLLKLTQDKLKYNYLVQGLKFHEAGSLEQAIQIYKKALEIDPGYAEALYYLAAVYSDRGEYSQAEAALERALKTDPQNAQIYYYALGIVHLKMGKDKEAESDFKKAIQGTLDEP